MQITTRLAIYFGLAMCNLAHAQGTETVRLADITDCSVFWSKAEALAYIKDERVKWTGKGACVGGMAEGLWTLRRDSAFPIGDEIKPLGWSEKLAYFHAGHPFGWVRKVDVSQDHDASAIDMIGENAKPPEWVRQVPMIQLLGERAGVMFSDAVWGIRYSAQDLAQRQWPDFSGKFTPQSLQGQGLGALVGAASAGGAVFTKTRCAIEKGMFPECSFEAGKPNFHIYYFLQSPAGGGRAGNKAYCPEPRQFSSCAAMGEAMAAPMRATMQEAAEKFRDGIAAQFQRMDETLKLASGASPAAPPPAAAADLDALPVGGLYAAADEALQRGDKPAAKAALRALLRRFPDHPLAVVAAQQLGQL